MILLNLIKIIRLSYYQVFFVLSILFFSLFSSLSAQEVTIIGAGSVWKQSCVMFPPAVSEASAKAAGKATDLVSRQKMLEKRTLGGMISKDLANDWMQIDFDDSAWLKRSGLSFISGDGRAKIKHNPAYVRGVDYFPPSIGLLALRNKFTVKDPKQVKLLSCKLKFRGGFVLYLNGKEVAREFLPKGKIDQHTPSEDYAAEVFFAKDKKGKVSAMSYGYYGDKSYLPLWEKRERDSKVISIDTSLLVEGVNQIALEIHRSDYPIECKSKKNGHSRSGKLAFGTVGLSEFFLKADTPKDNVITCVERPNGFQIWNANSSQEIRITDFENPSEELQAIKIVAAKNGQFHGQVVLSSDHEIKNLKTILSDLKSDSGVIDKNNLMVRFGALNSSQKSSGNPRDNGIGGQRYDLLLSEAPVAVPSPNLPLNAAQIKWRTNLGLPDTVKSACAVPIWVFVKTPKDIKPGLYKGSIGISAEGLELTNISIELSVADFKLPDIKDYVAPLYLWQSPESLAKQYDVEMWSEAHWVLVEKSLQWMGEMGNIALQFPLFAESSLGNAHSMIYWKKQNDGSFEFDFTIFDRYLKTALKYHSKKRLKILSLRAWGYEVRVHARAKGGRGAGAKVSLINDAGQLSLMKLPLVFESPENEKLLTPLLIQIRDRIKAVGLEGSICFGNGGDVSPSPQQAAMLNRILPGTPWVRDSHFKSYKFRLDTKDKKKTIPVKCTSMVWGGAIPDPKKKRLYGWKFNPNHMQLNFNRAGVGCLTLKGFAKPWSFRMWMESTLACGRNGNGRVGLDFFKLNINLRKMWGKKVNTESVGGSNGTLFGSYANSGVGQIGLGNNTTDLLGPGPMGPVSTIRFENARSGNQEAEARIIIERALIGEKLPVALAKECQDFLDERTNALRMWSLNKGQIEWGQLNWEQSTLKLYNLAGRATRVK